MNVGDEPLPALRFDGEQGRYLYFTEYDHSRPSYGATFCLVVNDFTIENLAAKREFKSKQFAGTRTAI